MARIFIIRRFRNYIDYSREVDLLFTDIAASMRRPLLAAICLKCLLCLISQRAIGMPLAITVNYSANTSVEFTFRRVRPCPMISGLPYAAGVDEYSPIRAPRRQRQSADRPFRARPAGTFYSISSMRHE